MPSNPYLANSIKELRGLEKGFLETTRDPKVAGHQRRVASRELGKVRAAIKEKNN